MKRTVELLTAVGIGCSLWMTDAVRAEAAGAGPVFAKFIRVEHRSDNPVIGIVLAEVEVFSDGHNIAPRGSVKQSSTISGCSAEMAIDGCKITRASYGTFSATELKPKQWWELEFPVSIPVEKIQISHRQGGRWNCLQHAWVMALNEKREVIWERQITGSPPIPKFVVTPQFPERNIRPAAAPSPLPPPFSGLWPAWDAPTAPGELAFRNGRAAANAEAVDIRYGEVAAAAALRLAGLDAIESKTEDSALVLRLADTPGVRDRGLRLSGTVAGFRIEATATLVTAAAGAPLLDLVLDAPGQGQSRPLYNRYYSATLLDGTTVSGFVGPVLWKKLHAGNAPLTHLSFDLGERRLELDVSKSFVLARLTTEADGSTHLRLEPQAGRAGTRRRGAVEGRFVSGARTAESTTVEESARVDQSFFKAEMAAGGALILGAGPRRGVVDMVDVLAGRLVVESADTAGAVALSKNPTPTCVYQPQGKADVFAQLAAESRTEAVEAAHTVRCLWRSMKSERPEAAFEVETTVRPLRAVKRAYVALDVTTFSTVKWKSYSDFQFAEYAAQARVAGAAGKPLIYTGGALGDSTSGVRLLEATLRPFGTPDTHYSAVRATVEPLVCGTARVTETADAFLRLELAQQGSDGTGLEAGKSYTLKYRVRLTLLTADDAGPIQVAHPGRRNPFFTLPEPARFELRIPKDAGTLTVSARSDDAGTEPKEMPGTLERRGVEQTPFGAEEVWGWTLKRHDPGVTAVTIQLKDAAGKVTAERFCEAVHVGKIQQPELADPMLPDEKAMQLELVDEINCADENDPHERLDFPGKSKIVDTAIGKCRSMVSERNASMLFGIKVKNRHRAHLVVAEYPDDAFRHMSMGVVEPCDTNASPKFKDGVSEGNGLRSGPVTGVQMGWPYPLSGKGRTMSLVYWPGRRTAYIGVSGVSHTPDWNPESVGAATVRRIRVYEVKGHLPALRVPNQVPGRLFGPYSESPLSYSTFGSDLDDDEGPAFGTMYSPKMVIAVHRRFYAKLYNAYTRYIEYLRFTGQNVSVDGMHRYTETVYPGLYHRSGKGCTLETYELLARMGAANGVAVMPTVQASHMISPYLEKLLNTENQRIERDPRAIEPTIAFIDKDGKRRATGLQGAGQPNFAAPEVWGDLVRIVEDMARHYEGIPGVAGITVLAGTWLRPGWDSSGGFSSMPNGDSNLDVSYDDRTIARFEAETGTKIPVAADDPGRYAQRYQWLMANAKEKWISWRCRMLYDLVADMRRAAAARGLNLHFIWNTHPYEGDWWLREALSNPAQALSDLRKTGYDPALFNRAGESTGAGWWDGLKSRNDWIVTYIGSGVHAAALESAPLRAMFDNGPDSAAFLFNPFRESRWPFKKYFPPYRWRELRVAAGIASDMKFGCLYAYPGPDYGAHDFLRLAAFGTPPSFITHTWQDVNAAEQTPRDMRRFAAAFRSLPLCRYERLTGNGLDRNLVVQKGEADGKTYLLVANPTWSALEVKLAVSAAGEIRDLVSDATVPVAADRPLALAMLPYDLKALRLDQGALVSGAETTVPPAAREQVEAELKKGDALLAAWGGNLPAGHPDRLTLVTETAAARKALTDGDLLGALQIKDGWKLRGALQHLIQPPGQTPATAPVADADTVLLFQFDEGSGAPVESGPGKRAMAGAAAYGEGLFGKALSGGEMRLPLAKDDPLLNGGSYTIEFRVKPAGGADWIANPPWFRLIGIADADNRDILGWDWNGRDKNAQSIQRINLIDGGNMPTRLQFYTPWQGNAWRHLALVYDKDAQQNNVRLYIDGRLEDQTMSYRPFTPQPAGATLKLGHAAVLIDALRVSSKARTLKEMGYPDGYDSTSWSRNLRD